MQASEVAGLFRSIVDEIRGAKHEGLDAMAKEWLTTASRGLLLQLEAELLSLKAKKEHVSLLPGWALSADSDQKLTLHTGRLPAVLHAYSDEMREQFRRLFEKCGFKSFTVAYGNFAGGNFWVSIRFPAAITANGGTKANQKRKAIVWDQLDLDGAVADAANLRMPTPTPAPAAKPKVEVTPLVPHKAGGSKEIVTRSKRSATMEQVKTEEVVDDEPIATRRVRRKVVAAKDEAA